MVPVTADNAPVQSGPDFKLVIHRTVHQLLKRKQEGPGWYGDPLSTAWVGLSLQAHDGYQDEVANVTRELKSWYDESDVVHEYDIAALGLMAKFFKHYERGDAIEDQFFAKLNDQKDRRESTTGQGAPQFQFFESHIYLYCALVGVKAYDQLEAYRDFLSNEVEGQRQRTWTAYNRMAFVETVALEVSEYDTDECRSVAKRMQKVDKDGLNEYELIPLVWFFQEQQEPLHRALPEEDVLHELIDDTRQKLWQRLYEELPFQLYLSDDIEYEFNPDVHQLTLLDSLLGRLENPILVFSEKQLEDHDSTVAEEKEFEIRVNRRRKLIGYVIISFLFGFIAVDWIITNPPPDSSVSAQHLVQAVAVLLMMHLEWRLEDISRDFGWTDNFKLIEDFVETVENRNWPAWILRGLFGLIGWVVVGYNWPAIQSFFQSF